MWLRAVEKQLTTRRPRLKHGTQARGRKYVEPLLLLLAAAVLPGCPIGSPQPGETRTFDGIQFQWCPPGAFTMGSPPTEEGFAGDETLHNVTLSNGFWLSRYEITQAQWTNIIGVNPSSHVGNSLPVDSVTWYDVQDFLIILNAITTGSVYRLPTEAEWEYACRAGTTDRFFWGADSSLTAIDSYAWYTGNSGGQSHAVGGKSANAWGLHDMSGNIYEWCQDRYGAYPASPVTDPTGPNIGTERVVRGGSWGHSADLGRSARRNKSTPGLSGDKIGFRLVRVEE